VKQYFIVEIESDSKPGPLGTMLCRELYLQCGGERTAVWLVNFEEHAHDLQQMLGGQKPLSYDPIIDDGHAPPNYQSRQGLFSGAISLPNYGVIPPEEDDDNI